MIYFLCHPDPLNYQWDIIPLAEGLEELGVPFISSADYWTKPDGGYLLRSKSDFDPLTAEAIVVSTGFLKWAKDSGGFVLGRLPDWLTNRPMSVRAKVIGLDCSDGYLGPITTKWADCFDLILRAQYNRRLWWPPNVRPWAFGLTNRIIASADAARETWSKRRGCLFAFGASHGYAHGSRRWAERNLLPVLGDAMSIDASQDDLSVAPDDARDALLWRQCVRRHSPSFFRRLGAAQACAAFCGELIPGAPHKVDFLVGGKRAKWRRGVWQTVSKVFDLLPRNVQPDSWRLWEAMACGAAVIHFDMTQSGWQLPVMPVNWEHYIGVDMDRPRDATDRIKSDPGLLERVAVQGRAWAFEHYSPKAMALRLLDLAGLENRAAASA